MKKIIVFSFVLLWSLPVMACDGCCNYNRLKDLKHRWDEINRDINTSYNVGGRYATEGKYKEALYKEREALEEAVHWLSYLGINNKERNEEMLEFERWFGMSEKYDKKRR